MPVELSPKVYLERLSAALFFSTASLLPFVGIIFTLYLLFFTRFWPIVCLYLFWIWFIDKNVSETGGRSSKWLRSTAFYKYVINYFPITTKVVPDAKIDPKKNYLCCAFPHGYLPIGSASFFIADVKSLMPHHAKYYTTLHGNFRIPMLREYCLGSGGISTTSKSISYLMNHPGGGKMLALYVGGASESINCKEGEYELVLKNRKGFIKLALKNGTSIIPVFEFGNNSTYKVLKFPEGSIAQRVQNFLKSMTRVAFLIGYGRGLFLGGVGFIPYQKPINVVFGAPIDVDKVDNPTQEDIDRLHQLFIEKLTKLFDDYKYEYEKNPEQCSLIIS